MHIYSAFRLENVFSHSYISRGWTNTSRILPCHCVSGLIREISENLKILIVVSSDFLLLTNTNVRSFLAIMTWEGMQRASAHGQVTSENENFMTELKSEVRSRRKGAITRQIILFEAERSFAKMGYQQTSITSIADTLKMSAANIHKHFRSKLDLAYAVVEQRLRPVQVIAGATPKERLRALPLNILGDLSHMSRDEPELFYILTNILSTENVSDIMRSRILDACPQVIEDMELSDAERFSEALADIFLAVCHPAIVATTEHGVLVSRVDNILSLMKQVMDIGASAPLAKAC